VRRPGLTTRSAESLKREYGCGHLGATREPHAATSKGSGGGVGASSVVGVASVGHLGLVEPARRGNIQGFERPRILITQVFINKLLSLSINTSTVH